MKELCMQCADLESMSEEHEDLQDRYEALQDDCWSLIEYVDELNKNRYFYNTKINITVDDLIDKLEDIARCMKETMND